MALSFSVKYRGNLDRKKLRIVDVTHDGSTSSISATSLELNYVDTAFNVGATVPVSAGSTKLADLTTNYGTALAMTALSSGAITTIFALGT